ncbi:hypothetical protein AVDCRST_MAG81-784 [uncultured Synechococcales cyanobacterium]|uniref:Uncharacterized protein n=1 Tax=uncultured Synechococcales cyanobacterium TaxID=1936017 RepID=A0A6J4UYA2_9CYAN|nr:hypothetical protein AVDCRST_MAG81-784 [uncultured Synechococcales cyanobacterium]
MMLNWQRLSLFTLGHCWFLITLPLGGVSKSLSQLEAQP